MLRVLAHGASLTKFEDLPPTTRQTGVAFTQHSESYLGAKEAIVLFSVTRLYEPGGPVREDGTRGCRIAIACAAKSLFPPCMRDRGTIHWDLRYMIRYLSPPSYSGPRWRQVEKLRGFDSCHVLIVREDTKLGRVPSVHLSPGPWNILTVCEYLNP